MRKLCRPPAARSTSRSGDGQWHASCHATEREPLSPSPSKTRTAAADRALGVRNLLDPRRPRALAAVRARPGLSPDRVGHRRAAARKPMASAAVRAAAAPLPARVRLRRQANPSEACPGRSPFAPPRRVAPAAGGEPQQPVLAEPLRAGLVRAARVGVSRQARRRPRRSQARDGARVREESRQRGEESEGAPEERDHRGRRDQGADGGRVARALRLLRRVGRVSVRDRDHAGDRAVARQEGSRRLLRRVGQDPLPDRRRPAVLRPPDRRVRAADALRDVPAAHGPRRHAPARRPGAGG